MRIYLDRDTTNCWNTSVLFIHGRQYVIHISAWRTYHSLKNVTFPLIFIFGELFHFDSERITCLKRIAYLCHIILRAKTYHNVGILFGVVILCTVKVNSKYGLCSTLVIAVLCVISCHVGLCFNKIWLLVSVVLVDYHRVLLLFYWYSMVLTALVWHLSCDGVGWVVHLLILNHYLTERYGTL